MKHSLAVATKMKEIVSGEQDTYSCSPDDAFILGMLHDIGYEFCKKQREHAQKGGEVLKAQGYKYWKEVYYHGIPQTEYFSPELNLLNYVDLITGPSGQYMDVQKRIEDISNRYGKGSWQEEEAIQLANLLNIKI